MGRSMKRKADVLDKDVCSQAQDKWEHFQCATQRRESVRLKNQALVHGQTERADEEKVLKHQISVEMSVVEGTAKFISATANKVTSLEAAKTLLQARIRVDMLRFDLNSLRRGRTTVEVVKGSPSFAALSLSKMRIPLLWRMCRGQRLQRKRLALASTGNVGHLAASEMIPDDRRFAVFCLGRIGSQIYSTAIAHDIDRWATDVQFDQAMVFNKVPPHFELNIEVYAIQISRSGESVSHKGSTAPTKWSKSLKKAVCRGLADRSGGQPAAKLHAQDFEQIGPQFRQIAAATLTLADAGEAVKAHSLYLMDGDELESNDSDSLPLFGQFCCRLATRPYCTDRPVICGPVRLTTNGQLSSQVRSKEVVDICDKKVESDAKIKLLQPVWASLCRWRLQMWRIELDKNLNSDLFQNAYLRPKPDCVIPVDRETAIQDGQTESEDGTDHKFTLRINSGDRQVCLLFDVESDCERWLVHLIQHAADHRRWKQAAENPMVLNVNDENVPGSEMSPAEISPDDLSRFAPEEFSAKSTPEKMCSGADLIVSERPYRQRSQRESRVPNAGRACRVVRSASSASAVDGGVRARYANRSSPLSTGRVSKAGVGAKVRRRHTMLKKTDSKLVMLYHNQ